MRVKRFNLESLARGLRGPDSTQISLAEVKAVGFDPEYGPLADVAMLPLGDVDTCRVSASYAGAGFGFWCPLAVGDVVVVAIPNGQPDEGPVVIGRLWGHADVPPSEMQGDQGDDGEHGTTETVFLRVQSGRSLVIRTAGSGEISIKAEGNGKVSVLSESGDISVSSASGNVIINEGTLKLARETDSVQVTIPAGSLTLAVSGASATGPALPLTLSGQITSGAARAKG